MIYQKFYGSKINTMKHKKHVTLASLITKHYEKLPATERKLADIVLDFPGELASYTATELAELAGVSKAAATRFFKRLGFSSFEEARRMARDSQKWGSPLYLQSENQLNESPSQHIQQYLKEEISNLTKTLNDISFDELDDICHSIVKAKKLWILGYRNSQYIAAYTRWQFIQFRSNVTLLPSGLGETLGEYIAEISKDDLVIVIGIRRRVAILPEVMQAIYAKGAPILYLTDPTASKTTAYAKWIIKSAVANSYLFDSYTSIMSIARFLAIESYRVAGKKGRDHLKMIETEHANLREFE